MLQSEMKELEKAASDITEIARGFGLDFYPMRYEICPADIIYTFGAYGMPTRFSHWSFGKAFHRMKLQYDLGLSKIYELVINSNPCYAFLLDGNSLVQNKMIIAHVLAHCDFFKNNARFSRTNRDIVESMTATAERIRNYEMEYGAEEVEKLLDAALSLQEHIDPSLFKPSRLEDNISRMRHAPRKTDNRPKRASAYDDLWQLDRPKEEAEEPKTNRKFPADPQKDLLLFIEEYSNVLEEWQRDILTTMREEMLYFWPQLETKIMNEGWASYWHVRIMRELDLSSSEMFEFAKLHSSVVQPSSRSLNPYYLGYKMFEDIERRWNEPTEEEQKHYGRVSGEGRSKIFEVREFDSDTSFIRNFLTKELVEDLDLYMFEKKGTEWKVTDKAWENVRDQLVYSRINGGHPYITVDDGDYKQNGEIYLSHSYEGMELDLKYLEKTLPYVHQLWGRPVHLETTIEEKRVLFSYDGEKFDRKFL